MKLKTTFLAALLAALGCSFFVGSAEAQNVVIVKSVPLNAANATEDNDTAILIRYTGTQASGTVQVSSGDILLKHGVLASEIADTTITGCGGTAGTLDVDNAACDTIGETLDRINASSNWRAVRLDALRSDNDAGNKLIDVSATQANTVVGIGLKWDTSVQFKVTRALVPNGARTIDYYLSGPSNLTILANPYPLGNQCRLSYFNETTTFASGTSTIQFFSEAVSYAAAGEVATENLIFTIAGGATTANKVIADFEFQPLLFNPNERCVVRVNNSAAASVPQIVAAAYYVPFP